MARQPNQTLRCGRLGLCALVALAGLSRSASIAQQPDNGPVLMPPGTTMQPNGPAAPGYPPQNYPASGYQGPGAAAATYPQIIQSAVAPPAGPYGPANPAAGNASGAVPPAAPPPSAYVLPPGPDDMVVDVRVDGNRTVATHKIMGQIHTRAGRPYNVQSIQDDVRALTRMGLFVDVRPVSERMPNGVVVVFRVVERPLLREVIVIGNDTYKTSVLKKEAEVKDGDAADPFAVENGRHKIEKYYQDHGYSKARVTVLEGNKTGDLRVIYVVDEGPRQRIFWVSFVGNHFVSGQRLKTLIDSHPPYFYLFSGEYDRKKLDEDVNKLTAYYRGFGFFHARIGREIELNDKQNWVTITFVIDEGPRYSVRNISFLGNRKFDNTRLAAKLKLLSDQPFDQNQQNLDLQQLRDEYGSEGYVFAKVDADNRFLEEPGKLDIVYNVEEGDKYRIGRVNIEIKGENPHTMITTVLNRLSVKPGDIADTREIRASERRLKAAQLFKVEPHSGVEPKIVYSPPDSDGTAVAGGRRQTTYYRLGGDSSLPPLPPGEKYLGIDCMVDLDRQDLSSAPSVESWLNPRSVDPPPTYQTNPTDRPDPADQGLPRPQTFQGGAPVPQTYEGQPTAGPQLPSNPVVYEVRYQGWAALPPQGQSWPPTAEYGGNNAYPAQPQGYTPAPQSQQYAYSPQSQVYAPPQQPQPYATGPAPQIYTPAPQQRVVPASYNAPADYVAQNPPSYAAPYGAPSGAPSAAYGAQPAYGAPAGTGTGYANPSAPPPATGTTGGGALYTPSGPAVDRPFAQTANGNGLYGDPSGANFPQAPGEPLRTLPLEIDPQETQTGRLMFGVGVNSDAGLVGNVTIDEQNFDWRNPPSSWEDVMEGRAWRGAGERFRLELVPGTQVQRYMITYQDPYLNDQPISFGLSGFYYQRIYTEWTENRVGGSVSLGYQFTHDLTGTLRFQGQDVTIGHPEFPVPDLLEVLGRNPMYTFSASLQHDTRDNPFMATEGHLITASIGENLGAFQYPTAGVEFSQYFRIFQRADRSGNHVLNLDVRAGYTGDNTPIFERYYAGGFSSIRGFSFRGVTPRDPVFGMGVGGDFQLLGTAQYMFPITADDMLKGVVFVDAGTVEPTITNWNQQVRVAPGLGLRISIPMMGPAPIALDFAFPINPQPGDQLQVFSFFVGFNH
jgi:outer membrane protein insertion porin family